MLIKTSGDFARETNEIEFPKERDKSKNQSGTLERKFEILFDFVFYEEIRGDEWKFNFTRYNLTVYLLLERLGRRKYIRILLISVGSSVEWIIVGRKFENR